MKKVKEQNNFRNENKGRGLFYGIIAVATFIIMAVGATFAYFTATTSSADASVKTGSTTLKLKYISYGSGWMNNDLIPANTEITEYSFENQNDGTIKDIEIMNNGLCKDDFGNSICSVYVFQVKNDANSPQNVSLDVISEVNQFASLNAMAYEISLPEDLTDYDSTEGNNGLTDPIFRKGDGTDPEDTEEMIDVVDGDNALLDLKKDSDDPAKANVYSPIFINRKGVVKTLLKYVVSRDEGTGTSVKRPAIDRLLVNTVLPDGSNVTFDNPDDSAKERTTNVAGDIEIEGGTTKTFALVLYIKNEEIDQTTTDAAKTFSGRVVISSGDGSTGVSGTISVVTDEIKDGLQSSKE